MAKATTIVKVMMVLMFFV